jgi:hypothetical protein
MKILAMTVLITTLIMALQPISAQKITSMPILEMMLQTMGNFSQAKDTIKKNCKLSAYGKNTRRFFYVLRKEALRSKVTPLNKNQKINKMVADCKRQLKQKRSNTARTDGIFLLVDKALA